MKLRKFAALAAGAAITAASAAPGAGAASAAPAASPGDSYAAQATASAVRLSLFGQALTVAQVTSDVTSPDQASASGLGAEIGPQAVGATEATASGVGRSDGSATPTCSDLVLPPEVPVLDVTAGCSTSQAAVTAEGSSADATATGLHLSVGGDPLVTPVLDALPVATLTDTLITGLAPLLNPADEELPVPTALVVDQLTALLQDALTGNGVSLLTVDSGAVESHASSASDRVLASSDAAGAVVEIMDRGGDTFGTQPILTIRVGASTTSVARDRASGETSAEQTAAPVTVTVADDVALLLQLPEKSFEVPPGQKVDLPLPPPLTSSVTLSSGSTAEIEDGARADAASIALDLLGGVNGGVQLGLSTGSSSVVGKVAPPPPTPTTAAPSDEAPAAAAPAQRTMLPRTGIEGRPLQAAALVLLLGAAGLGELVLRSRRRSRASSRA